MLCSWIFDLFILDPPLSLSCSMHLRHGSNEGRCSVSDRRAADQCQYVGNVEVRKAPIKLYD
jgi:hypothetical protein